jgi:tetratricopeptide (TPR) repeat protein
MMAELDQLIARGVSGEPIEAALDHIGTLIDAAFDFGMPKATDRAFILLDELDARLPRGSPFGAIAHYFRANAWNNRLIEAGADRGWSWEQTERQNQILELRRALVHPAFEQLDAVRALQIMTNLGNMLSAVGRPIEAVDMWDRAIALFPAFGNALGNRGLGFQTYAQMLYDGGHACVMLSEAHASLSRALARKAFYEDGGVARPIFKDARRAIARRVDVKAVRAAVRMDKYPLGRSKRERRYRTWCLNERLFLNPLNDLDARSIAARDILTLPSIVDATDDAMPPTIIGFYNQMKQEFVSARFMLFEGLEPGVPHFSDRDVLLYNTLDYPAYALAVERVRAAFRLSYSLLDKVGVFLNAYLQIGRPPHKVQFRNVFYAPNSQTLLSRFEAHPNLPLRGLFWLSKDLYDPALKGVLEPDAEALADIRNHLEHKYLQLHSMGGGRSDDLRASLSRADFEQKALRLLKKARGALIYLSLAVRVEEAKRSRGDAVLMPLVLDTWDDAWKL